MDDYEYGYYYNNNNDLEYLNTDAEESYETSWKIISEKILQILRRKIKPRITYEPLYTRIHRSVCKGKSRDMFQDLMTLCTQHVRDIKHEIGRSISSDDLTQQHLITVGSYTKDYLTSIKSIAQIFSYLNKNYVAERPKGSLFSELAGLYTQMVLNHRIPILMHIAEEILKVPCSFSPSIMHRIFNDLHAITEGKYSVKYIHLFSKYCVNILPAMKESDLESHIAEVKEFQERQRLSNVPQGNQALKRRADEAN